VSDDKILAIDVGGSNVKLLLSSEGCERRRFPSGPELTPGRMVDGVRDLTADWSFDRVSVGIPAPVHAGRVVSEPANLGPGWVGFDFEEALGRPTKLVNDAAMQALGSYEGGKMLFLGLGTGLGSALVVDGIVEPMELAHLPFRKATFEDYLGLRGQDRLGKKKWRAAVAEAIDRLNAALQPDYVVLGGGEAKKLRELPAYARLGANNNAFLGAFRLWDSTAPGSEGSGAPRSVAYDRGMATFLHTMVRITDPERSRSFYEALGFTFAGDFDIVRDGEVEATNYFFSLGDDENVLELTYNHDGRTYELGSAYGHIAIGVDDLDGTLARLAEQHIEPERPPYSVREGGSRLCFVQDPDGYRIELIESSA
jgi:polyphosphate glucokinase